MKINAQNILAISVLLVSITAVVVSSVQARIMKEQQQIMHQDFEASLWPHVEMSFNYSVGTSFEIVVTNKGVGPAIIENFTIRHQNEFLKDWDQVKEITAIDSVSSYSVSNSNIMDAVLSAGESRTLFAVWHPTMATRFYEWYNASTFKICYKSVYDSYWVHQRHSEKGRLISRNNESSDCSLEGETFQDVMVF
jgi:hypothetical protein